MTEELPGLVWYPNGQSALSGPLLDLDRKLDGCFVSWAHEEGAVDHVYPPLLPAEILGRLDYLRSFPHLATFAVALDPAEANLHAFTAGDPVDADGTIAMTELAPVRDVLTPAACYHVYPSFDRRTLTTSPCITTRATCFRREAEYLPLERQWSFSMREIVRLGTAEEIRSFLDRSRERIDRWCRKIALPVAWKEATDPFFDPSRNPKALTQRVDPVKMELVFQDRLAIASTNLHRSYFGELFAIRRGAEIAHSACVAFGIERWIRTWITCFGVNPGGWPEIP